MANRIFADIVHESLELRPHIKGDALILELMDTTWVQRLRDISQTGNTRLVYMFSEHSRFGHSIEVAYLASKLLDRLAENFPEEVEQYRLAISAAAILHDIAHLAPGSHTAFKVWFPNDADRHEHIATKIIAEDKQIKSILEKYKPGLTKEVNQILTEDDQLPAWTWQILSGGAWNIDRGNWCIADSVLAGVSYGKYNITALTDSITITPKGELALKENRLDAMLHFAVSRHAMYKQIYQHRVLLAADKLTAMIVKRCRDLNGTDYFADEIMLRVLNAKSAEELSIGTIFKIRESWWRYHLLHWSESSDQILKDLSDRLLNRRLLKTVAMLDSDSYAETKNQAERAVKDAGFDPNYYLFDISSVDMLVEDSKHAMKVLKDNGVTVLLKDVDSIFQTILTTSQDYKKTWLVMPKRAKDILGRKR